MTLYQNIATKLFYCATGGRRGEPGFYAKHPWQAAAFVPGSPEDAAFKEEWDMDQILAVGIEDLYEDDEDEDEPPFPFN